MGIQEDLDVVLSHLERFSVALIDIRLHGFDNPDGFTLAEILQNRGLKVGIASVHVKDEHKLRARELGIPTFDTFDMLLNSDEKNVFQRIARETLEFQPAVQLEQVTVQREQEI